MAGQPDKRAVRDAAAIIERAVDAYGAGDLPGSAKLFEEALAILPDHARAKIYLGWVRDLSSGRKKLDHIDEETLLSISDSLASDEEQTREKRAVASPLDGLLDLSGVPESIGPEDSPWDPVPLSPAAARAAAAAAHPMTSAPPLELAPRPAAPVDAPRASAPPPAEAGTRKTPSATLLGVVPPEAASLLAPAATAKGLYENSTENTGSVTREWAPTPTASNLPPLDVPELTDEQIQDLLALDGSPIALEVTPPPAALPRGEKRTDEGIGPELEGRTIEMEAEPEQELPHLNPTHVPMLADGDADKPKPRKRDSTTPDSELPHDFDTADLTPTRERRDLLRAFVEADDELQLPPLENPARGDDILGEGTNPTNPFIKRRMAEYTGVGTGNLPKVDDLPPAPSRLGDTNPLPAATTLVPVQEPLDRGDVGAAMAAAEQFLAQNGGLEGEAAQTHRWLFERVYESSLSPLSRVPRHGQPAADLDPKSAFLLSRLDGMSSVDDLLDISGMPRLEALRALALLVKRGVVVLK
jgi:hypothetical protein